MAVGGGAAYWFTRDVGPADQALVVESTEPSVGLAPSGAAELERAVIDAPDAPRPEAGPAISTVLYPLVVELELLEADRLSLDGDGPAIGSGANARFSGRIVSSSGHGVRATVEFVAGPNQGRVLHCDATGAFGATNLQPGLDVVEVRGPGILGSRREVRLRRRQEQLLNIGYGRPAVVYGTVTDSDGEPLEGARVSVDGQRSHTDSTGQFYVAAVASGKVLLEIEHGGYTSLRQDLNVAIGRVYRPEDLRFQLAEPASLEIVIPEAVGGPGPAQVYLLPSNTKVQRTFPWYTVSPVIMAPGSVHRVDGLPATVVEVRVFHEGALASPKTKSVHLRAGENQRVEVHLKQAPLLTGSVLQDGEPASGVPVRLEAPDRMGATLAFFRETQWFLESEILPPIPPAVQEVRTDSQGRFVMTAWSDLAPTRFLQAEGLEGETWAGRMVGPDDEDVVLVLEERPQGEGSVVLHIPKRHQGLPVEVKVQGAPRDPMILPDHESLVIEGLEEGTWLLRAEWYSLPLIDDAVISVRDEYSMRLELPREAIVGHDEEAWRRAGREYPGER